jgi:tetratricopeptide (TPR) repeat protein
MSWTKLAKEALDRGDYADAVSSCDLGLSDDPNSYSLLLIKAAASKSMQSYDLAEQSLMKAVELQPNQPMAWQGLLQLSEELLVKERKGREKWAKLKEQCLVKLVVVASDAKREEFGSRLYQFYIDEGRLLDAANLVKDKDFDKFKVLLRQWERACITSEVDNAKFRLGADPVDVLTAKTSAQVFNQSPLTDYLEGDELVERLDLICKHFPTEKMTTKLKELIVSGKSQLCTQLASDINDEPTVGNPQKLNEGSLKYLLSQANAQRTINSIKLAHKRLDNYERWYMIELTKCKAFLKRLEGLVWSEEGRFDESVCALEPILEINPTDKEICVAMLKNYEAMGFYEKAVTLCQNDDLQACHFLIKLGKYEQVKVRLLNTKSTEKPHERELLLGIAEWYTNNPTAAYDHFIDSAKHCPTFSAPFAWLGRYYRDQVKDMERSEKCFRKALSLDQGDREAASGIASLALRKQDYLQTVSILEPLLQDYPQDYESWRNIGVAYYNLKAFAKAAHSLHLCLRGECRDERVLLLLGHSYYFEGKWKAASRAFQAVLSINEGSWTATVGLARALVQLTKFETAIGHLKSVVNDGRCPKIIGNELVNAVIKAAYFSLRERFSASEARQYLQHVDEAVLSKCDLYLVADYMNIRSTLGEKEASIERALELYEQFLKEDFLSPQSKAKIHARIARLYLKADDTDTAHTHAKAACKLLPNSKHDTLLAVIKSKLGNNREAERHYGRALVNSKSTSEKAWIYGNLGLLYATPGVDRRDLAKLAFQQGRLTDVQQQYCGESLYGLATMELSDLKLLTLAADSSRSIHVHEMVTRELITNCTDSKQDEEMMLAILPVVERLYGVTGRYKSLLDHLDTLLLKIHTVCTEPASTLSMQRSIALHTHTLIDFSQSHPFDTLALILLTEDIEVPLEERVRWVRGRMRVVEERYGREGTRRRHFSDVARFQKLESWLLEHRDVL